MTTLDASTPGPQVAVILAAGQGTRLYPTTNRPKPLTRVLGLTLAERVMCTLCEASGIRRFIVTVGSEARVVKAHFTDIARRRGFSVAFVEAPDWQLGNGASALAAREHTGDAAFFLVMRRCWAIPQGPASCAWPWTATSPPSSTSRTLPGCVPTTAESRPSRRASSHGMRATQA
jgi:hypothetical protein